MPQFRVEDHQSQIEIMRFDALDIREAVDKVLNDPQFKGFNIDPISDFKDSINYIIINMPYGGKYWFKVFGKV
jgi:hypothetical protein